VLEPLLAAAAAANGVTGRPDVAAPRESTVASAAGRELEPSERQSALSPAVIALPPAAAEPRFPANLRDALAKVEAWMSQGAEAQESSNRPAPTPGTLVPRALPSNAGSPAASAPSVEVEAPRLSIGRIEIEVVSAEPAAAAPVWPAASRAPVGNAPAASAPRHSGRLGFGLRQG
jgi:hypothetical protein